MLLLHIFKLFSSNFMFAGHRPWKPQLANQPEGTIDGQCFSGHAVTEASSIYRKSDINFTVESHVFFCVASDGCRKKNSRLVIVPGWAIEQRFYGLLRNNTGLGRKVKSVVKDAGREVHLFYCSTFKSRCPGLIWWLLAFDGFCVALQVVVNIYIYNSITKLKFSVVVYTIYLDIFQSR